MSHTAQFNRHSGQSSGAAAISGVWVAGFAVAIETGIFLAQVFTGLGLLLAIVLLLSRRTRPISMEPELAGILLLLIWMIVAGLLSSDPRDSLLFTANKWGMTLLAFLAAVHIGHVHGAKRWLMPALLIGGVIGALSGITQFFLGIDYLYGQAIEIMPGGITRFYLPVGLLNMALTFAAMQMIVFLFLLPWAWKIKTNRWLVWLGMFLILLSIVLAFRRGPWLGLAAGTGLFVLTRGKKVAIPSIIGGILLLAVSYTAVPAFRARINDTVNLSTASESERLLLWQAAWDMGNDHPVTGIGPGQWRDTVDNYVPEQEDWDSLAHPHSDPLYGLAVSGWPGLLILVTLTITILQRRAMAVFRRRRHHQTYPLQLNWGLLFAFVALIVAGLFQCYLLDGEIMIAIAFLLGLTITEPEAEL